MLSFGKKSQFEIHYLPYSEIFKDDPDLTENPNDYVLGGVISFWMNNKNIFAYKDNSPNSTYDYFDLSYLVEFFCLNLHYHITNDPFPVQTKSKIGREMMEETKLVEGPDNDITKYLGVNWDAIDREIYKKIDIWNIHHGFLSNSAGTFLPDGYFQKVDNKLEFSWKNEFPFESESGLVYALHEEGVEYVDLKLYRDTVVNFCLEFLKRLSPLYPEIAEGHRKELQKAIDVKLETF